ncbi:hypothetical protein [Cohnella rhizosphaerae]|uniref:Bacterial alpha-L-rhamnosidase N-terminal domain-containing protein n=1 Tax=Cohnella rhizosphaerae TaxID=1457232 RepID=A0A9X4L0C9_9BACL|nr:hypothetical protein [Cohnella rhizosphaerae]MDG0811207.1 hypothetical protein [Cohnella rhizosphaerae]
MLQSEALLAHDTRDWRGEWIWFESPDRDIRPGRHTMALFRRTFQAAGDERLIVRVSANSRYRLFLNGESVSIGPCKGDANRRFYETVEIGGLLRDGMNVLAAQVVHYVGTEPWTMGVSGPISIWSERNGGFLLDGALSDDGGPHEGGAAYGRQLAVHGSGRIRRRAERAHPVAGRAGAHRGREASARLGAAGVRRSRLAAGGSVCAHAQSVWRARGLGASAAPDSAALRTGDRVCRYRARRGVRGGTA